MAVFGRIECKLAADWGVAAAGPPKEISRALWFKRKNEVAPF
jgi:hypothetical protein